MICTVGCSDINKPQENIQVFLFPSLYNISSTDGCMGINYINTVNQNKQNITTVYQCYHSAEKEKNPRALLMKKGCGKAEMLLHKYTVLGNHVCFVVITQGMGTKVGHYGQEVGWETKYD